MHGIRKACRGGLNITGSGWQRAALAFMLLAVFLLSQGFAFMSRSVALDTDKYPLYEAVGIEKLAGAAGAYKGNYVVLTGTVGGVNKNGSEVTLSDAAGVNLVCKCSEKELREKARGLSKGDIIRIFGKAVEAGVFNKNAELSADLILEGKGPGYAEGDYVRADGNIVDLQHFSSRDIAGGHVSFVIPPEWDTAVEHRLLPEELGVVEGYQYRLNEIYGSSSVQPESLFIAYFGYELLENDNYRNETFMIERAIASNILKKEIPWNVSFPLISRNTYYGQRYDYYQSSYKVGVEGFRTEFIFIPDGKDGIVIILYVYRSGSTGHIDDVMTVLRSLQFDT